MYEVHNKVITIQRTAKRYDDGGHGKYVELRQLLLRLAAVTVAATALPPQTNISRMTKEKGTGRNYSQLCVV